LGTERFFFCRSDLFDDSFEGSYPEGEAIEAALPGMLANVASDSTLPQRIEQAERMLSWRKQLRESVLVSCWHISEYESAAMWKLYARCDKGVAIKSTVQSLIDSIECAEEVHVGAVRYRDYDLARFPSMNVFHPFVSKRQSFEYERELRAVIWDEERFAGLSGTYPLPEHRCSRGMLVKADLGRLIEEIRVVPGASAQFRQSVVALCDTHDLRKDVKQSRLADTPLY
jgi:hypothetical protein